MSSFQRILDALDFIKTRPYYDELFNLRAYLFHCFRDDEIMYRFIDYFQDEDLRKLTDDWNR